MQKNSWRVELPIRGFLYACAQMRLYGAAPSGGSLLASASAKSQAFSKLVRKACRAVFKRVIRQMLLRDGQQMPLCNSNNCIVLHHPPGGAAPLLMPAACPGCLHAALPFGLGPQRGMKSLLQSIML